MYKHNMVTNYFMSLFAETVTMEKYLDLMTFSR